MPGYLVKVNSQTKESAERIEARLKGLPKFSRISDQHWFVTTEMTVDDLLTMLLKDCMRGDRVLVRGGSRDRSGIASGNGVGPTP